MSAPVPKTPPPPHYPLPDQRRLAEMEALMSELRAVLKLGWERLGNNRVRKRPEEKGDDGT